MSDYEERPLHLSSPITINYSAMNTIIQLLWNNPQIREAIILLSTIAADNINQSTVEIIVC